MMTPTEASIALHERICYEIIAAKSAYQARRLDRMCRHIEKCLRVLLALENDVKLVKGAAEPVILANFYLHVFERLRTVQRNRNVEAAYDAIIGDMRYFCEKMRTSSRKIPTTPMKAPETADRR